MAGQAPPMSPYGSFSGSLFQYSRNLVAFESADESSSKKCILLGGLSDGLIPTPYTKDLENECSKAGWSLVQPVISSSYLGFGNGDLGRDTKEIGDLMLYLKCHRSAEVFALVGHSTGCQNSVHFLKHGKKEFVESTKIVVLQAPVSDREDAMMQPMYSENIKLARGLVSDGKENEMMPRSAFWAPITAKRFLDLQDVDGADDFFSSDLTEGQMVERLGHIGELECTGLQLLLAFSGSDEYVPGHVDTRLLTERLVSAMNSRCKSRNVAIQLFLPKANHNLSEGEKDGKIFVQKVAKLLLEAKG